LAAVAGALLMLTRPDGVLMVGPLALDLALRRLRARQVPWSEAGLFLGLLAPWIVFATLYFGSPLPHSILAKSLAYRLPADAALVRLLQHYSTPFFEHQFLGPFWHLAGFFVYLALSALGGITAMRREARAWPLVAFPGLYFVVYAAANPLIFRWYLAPPLPLYILLILTGVDRLAAHAAAGIGRRPAPWLRTAVLTAVAAGFGVSSLAAWTLRPDHGPSGAAPEMAWHELELYYAEVGQALAEEISAETVVAAGDVGALGYYSGARILDTVGLISPEATSYYPLDPDFYLISYAIPPDLVLDYAPEYVVLLEVYGRAGLLRDDRFQASYALDSRIDTDIYGSDGLLVFRRSGP
jgi:hypothetical protein